MNKLLTEQEVADMFSLKVGTVRAWRKNKDGPPFIKVMGSIRYDEVAIQDYLKQNTMGNKNV